MRHRHPRPSVLFPAAMLVGLLPVLALLWPSYRAWLVAGWRGCRVVVWRHRWPSLCSVCGLQMLGGRRVRVPELVSVDLGPGWWRPAWVRLDVIPLAQHDRPTWSRYEDRLGRQVGYRFSSWIPSETTGGMEITLLRDPLRR